MNVSMDLNLKTNEIIFFVPKINLFDKKIKKT
jgi:hypothetical protein